MGGGAGELQCGAAPGAHPGGGHGDTGGVGQLRRRDGQVRVGVAGIVILIGITGRRDMKMSGSWTNMTESPSELVLRHLSARYVMSDVCLYCMVGVLLSLLWSNINKLNNGLIYHGDRGA